MELRKENSLMPASLKAIYEIKNEAVFVITGMHWKGYLLPLLALTVSAVLAVIKTFTPTTVPVFYLWDGQPAVHLFMVTEYLANIVNIVEWAVIVSVMAISAVTILRRAAMTYVITDRRVIKYWGVFTCSSSEAQIGRCKTVDTRQDFMSRICGTGDVIVSTPETEIRFDNVEGYKRFAEIIRENQKKES